MTTFDDIASLTVPQKNLLKDYGAKGRARFANREGVGGSVGIDPSQTFVQARQVDALCRELITLISEAQREAQVVMEHHRRKAVDDLEKLP